MANVNGSGFKRWDTTTGAAFDGTNGPRDPLVTQIRFEVGATGGVTTLQVDGKTYFSWTIPGDAVMTLDYAGGQHMKGLACTALGTNTIVVVHYA
ncbi:MAG: hypothetical protein E4G90_06125 [Gemmatimonadales bacterium]|nr:MAG: hypothetical protein E4G90_06125 [Gemmatimonadales bacterium]